MANVKTDRKPLFGNSRSHALNATKKKQGLNKQKVTIDGKTVVMTTRDAKKIRKAARPSSTVCIYTDEGRTWRREYYL